MSIKLYVGNLPMQMTETELKELFTEAGNVASAKIITDRQTGQPRGFGFVEMETKLEGTKAISMLNGRQVEGRVLAVNEARPQARTGGGGVAAAAVAAAATVVVAVAAVAAAVAAATAKPPGSAPSGADTATPRRQGPRGLAGFSVKVADSYGRAWPADSFWNLELRTLKVSDLRDESQ